MLPMTLGPRGVVWTRGPCWGLVEVKKHNSRKELSGPFFTGYSARLCGAQWNGGCPINKRAGSGARPETTPPFGCFLQKRTTDPVPSSA
jgi:hypothetical protein